MGVCPLSVIVQCFIWRWPWYSADHRFREARPCVCVWCSGTQYVDPLMGIWVESPEGYKSYIGEGKITERKKKNKKNLQKILLQLRRIMGIYSVKTAFLQCRKHYIQYITVGRLSSSTNCNVLNVLLSTLEKPVASFPTVLMDTGSLSWYRTQTNQLLSTLSPTRSLSRNVSVIHKLTDSTPDHICHQFETAYQLVLQSRHTPSLNIR